MMSQMKTFVLLAALVSSASIAFAQQLGNQGAAASIPGAQTALGMMASASDGMSRYLAPDGPIQPALTAISGLPMRAGEMANSGITSISSGFKRGGQRLSQAAGQNGQIRMPGLDTAASMMPASISSIGTRLGNMISTKNNIIRNQAQSAVDAANRMGQTMRQGLQVRSSSPMEHASQLMGQTQQMMSKGGQELKSQLQQHFQGSLGRLHGMQGMGSDLRDQATGYGRTITQGVQGATDKLRQTGQQLVSQVQQNHNKNMSSMSNMLGSLQGSMGQMGSNMQKNLGGLTRQASNVAQQLSSSLQSAAQAPMQVLQNLGNSMKGAASGGSGGRY